MAGKTAVRAEAACRKEVRFRFTLPERRVFRPKEKLTVSEWAQRYRIVTNGPVTGKWRNEVTPYLVEPMDTWNLPYVRKIILCFAPQTGKTQVAFNCLCYAIDQDPGPSMYAMPDEKTAKRIGRRRIRPMFRGSPRIAELMSPRADDATAFHVQFRNGMDLMMVWATSASELASESVRYMIFDETDKFPEFAGKEADPVSLGEIRTNAYPFTKKILYMSTPTTEDNVITQVMRTEADEVRQYHARCPLCMEWQLMEFDGIRWPEDKRDPREIVRKKLARYKCRACGGLWDDYMRDTAVRQGKWVADQQVERPRAVGFHLPSWYSPFISLSDVAAAFLKGLRDTGKLMTFVTQHKAQPWVQVVVCKTESEILKAKCELPPQTVPEVAVAVTCGIDVQKFGFWFAVRAWARDYTSWLIHYGFLATWADVEGLLFGTVYPVMNSGEGTMRIWRAAIDTGGGDGSEGMSMTEETYWWLIEHSMGKGVAIWGTKGSNRPIPGRFKVGPELLKTPTGKPLPHWFRIISVDTAQMKDMYHYGIAQAVQNQPRAAYLHSGTGQDYASQIMAEEKRQARNGAMEWVKVRRDNHLLDAEVLCMSCAHPDWMGGGVNLFGGVNRDVDGKRRANMTGRPAARSPWMTHGTCSLRG